MPSLNILRSRHTESINAAKAIRDKAVREDRDLSAGELIELEKHLEDADQIVREMDRQEGMVRHMPNARDGYDARLATHGNLPNGVPRAILGNPGRSGPQDAGNRLPSRFLPTIAGDDVSFGQRLVGGSTDTGGFASFGEFLSVVGSGRFDPRLNASGMRSDITSEGGALVPEQYRAAMIDAAMEETVILQRVTKFPMDSGVLHLAGWDGNTHTSRSLFGGFTAAWERELETMSVQDAKTRKITLNAKKLAILAQSSNELLNDAIAWEKLLGKALIDAVAWELDYQLINGTGAGRPLGILNAGSRISVAKESSQTAATIWYDNVVKMFARLHPSCFKNAIWIGNPATIPQLMALDYHESAAALGSALISDSRYMAFKEDSGRFSLFGIPMYFTEKCPTLGTEGDIILVDPTQIAFGQRAEITVQASSHAGFASDSTYFRCITRCDAMPMWAKEFTPQAGSTLSWAVTLATRG
jgi:HK97 family phage major capsid protein